MNVVLRLHSRHEQIVLSALQLVRSQQLRGGLLGNFRSVWNIDAALPIAAIQIVQDACVVGDHLMRRTGRELLTPSQESTNQEIVFRPLPLQSIHIGDDLGCARQEELPNSTAGITELQDDIESAFSTVPDAIQIVDELTKGPEPVFWIIHASQLDTFPTRPGIRMQ